MPLRILIVSNFFPPKTVGGAELVAFRQAQALAARGHYVIVLAGADAADGASPGQLSFDRYGDLPVYRLVMRSLSPAHNFHWPAAANRVAGLIASHEIQVVLCHNLMGLGTDTIIAARQAGARCLVTLHDHWGFCFRATRLMPDSSICRNHERCAGCQAASGIDADMELPIRLRRDYIAWCLRHAERLIVPSQYMAQAYHEVGFAAARTIALSNGIDLENVPAMPKRPSPTGEIRFLCSAYLGEHKGIPVLLEALSRLAADSTGTPWRLTLAGDGHLRKQIEHVVANTGLSGRLRMTGRLARSDFLSLLTETDVVVLPSIWPENEPVSLLEAISSGTAQIATNLGGNGALVDDGRSGYLVQAGDADALAAAMRRYLADPGLAGVHGDYNRRRRERFDESETISSLEELMHRPASIAAEPTEAEPVVICGGGLPQAPVAALVRELHAHLLPGRTPRLLWHAWCDPLAWRAAAVLWLWDRNIDEVLVGEAAKHGIPVLAPATEWTVGLSRHFGGVILYRTYLEAMAALRSLLAMPDLRHEFASRSSAAAAAVVAAAPRPAFDLRSQVAA